MAKKIVYKVDGSIPREDILCTTYQMRNFHAQFKDGFFSVLDVMNYIQHHQAVKWAKKGDNVLDICCGRGLVLPMMRYQRKNIRSYTGVDIEPKNARFLTKRVTDGKEIEEGYYPFEVNFVESNVDSMSDKFPEKHFDYLIYTSSIEHMHKDVGYASLKEAYKISKYGARLFISCPNTKEDQDGYDTQYKAHVYEWKRSELIKALNETGWLVDIEYGLLMNKRDLKREAEKIGILSYVEQIEKVIPSEWMIPVLAPLFPSASKEIGFLCTKEY